jgi:hypothetical protein
MIEVSAEQLERAESLLADFPKAEPRALSSALNRAAEGARTDAVKKARETYVITAGRVRETIGIGKATPDNLIARVKSQGRPRALSYFNVRPKLPGIRRRKPLFAQVQRGGGGTIKGAFVARLQSGHLGVFNRVGKSSLPIIQRYGPSVPQMIGSETVTEYVELGAQRRLDNRIDHEINRLLQRWGN